MLQIQRFDSFAEIKDRWNTLENQTAHYPFQAFWYQEVFAVEFCNKENVYLLGVFDEDKLLALGGFEKVDNALLFLGMKQVLGGQDLTDYGDLLFHPSVSDQQAQEVWSTVFKYLQKQEVTLVQLDFVREDSLTYEVFQASNFLEKLGSAGIRIEKQEVAPYIIIPRTWEEYVQSLSRKDRHELKRKMKRFEEQHAFHFCSETTMQQDFENFIRLHRLSDTAKEKFMSESMRQFFWKMITAEKNDYRVDFCFLEIDQRCVASIMSLIGQKKALLYNSGFDPAYSYYSVGLILHSYLIKKSIESGLEIHDFLRGDERYKYDLGATDMQLYKIMVNVQEK